MQDKLSYSRMLLDEFEEICGQNEIEFEVIWGPEKIGSGVLMTAGNCRRFMDAVKTAGREDRALESWAGSPRYPNGTIRYVGNDILCYNILDYTSYRNHGVFVEINIARLPARGLKDKIYRIWEKEIAVHSDAFRRTDAGKKAARDASIYRWGLRLSGGEEGLRRRCFSRMLGEQDAKITEENRDGFRAVRYSGEYLDYCILEDIGGDDFFAENAEKIEELSGQRLASVREAKDSLDRKRSANAANFRTAGSAWETILGVDEEIRGAGSEAGGDEQAQAAQEAQETREGAEDR